jgi:hypothetical protein
MLSNWKEPTMSQTGANQDPGLASSDTIQTVGQLKEWLKEFPDHYRILAAFQGQPLVNWVQCRHGKESVIIEVPRLETDTER